MELTKEKKENVIGFRVDNSFYNELEALSSQENVKKSDVIRKALSFYLNFHSSPFPMILLGRNEFGFMLDHMKEDGLRQLADLSYKNGIQSLNNILERYSIKKNNEFKLKINFWMNILIDFAVSPESLNWFDSIEWAWVKKPRKTLRIIGNHGINTNFSVYCKHLFTNYMNDYEYHLTKEVILEDMLILEFSNE